MYICVRASVCTRLLFFVTKKALELKLKVNYNKIIHWSDLNSRVGLRLFFMKSGFAQTANLKHTDPPKRFVTEGFFKPIYLCYHFWWVLRHTSSLIILTPLYRAVDRISGRDYISHDNLFPVVHSSMHLFPLSSDPDPISQRFSDTKMIKNAYIASV